MNEDYLWDRSGPPDPEIERLERALAPLRYRHRAEFLAVPAPRSRPRWTALAAAAALLVAAGLLATRPPGGSAAGWQIASLQGSASLGGKAAAVSATLGAGKLLRTGYSSTLTLQSDDVGKIDLGPDSELRAASAHKVTLRRGHLHAFIWAPPRQFVVDTPSARAVDLGCEYTLNVDAAGDGLVHVDMGWVAFQYQGHESFIPAGAECVTRRSLGPGIPFYADAPASWRASLSDWESGDSGALAAVLRDSRPRDALTLWHLLARVPAASRGAVFDRFAQLVSLPPEVRRDRVTAGDPHVLDLCWDALNLENTSWWRGWERRWQ